MSKNEDGWWEFFLVVFVLTFFIGMAALVIRVGPPPVAPVECHCGQDH